MRKKSTALLFSLLSGALTALAFPIANVSVLAWISLIPLFFILSYQGPQKAFLSGLTAGFAFYGILLYWIPAVPAHYGNIPLWLSVIIYLILILLLGLFWAVFGLIFAVLRPVFPRLIFCLAPFLWIGLEFVLTSFLTGFPWGLLGYSQFRNIPFIQLSAVTGVYGLSFVLVLLQSTFVLALVHKKKRPFVAALVLLAIVHGGGWLSLKPVTPNPSSLTAAVIQGNVSSDLSWDMISSEEILKIFEDHQDLSRRANDQGAKLIIWPELTVPLCFSCPQDFYTSFNNALFRFVQEHRCTLLLGTNETSGPPEKKQYFNATICLHPDLSLSMYAKMHLVPFGEYIPYKKFFFFIETITHAIGTLTPGKEPVLHETDGLKFGSPICYEIVFPALVRRFVAKGAEFLVTITNDGWYGRTSAPFQHFAMAVFRAVENRRFLLRAATTGISGIVDPYGRILAQSPIMTRTFLTGTVTPSRRLSFYVRFGDVLPWAGLTLSLLSVILCVLKKIRKRDRYALHRQSF